MRKLCFLSGLPRSGSTLLAALLRQNPRVHAHMTSPLSGMLDAMVAEMSASEFAEFIDDERRWNVLRGIVDGYYAHTPRDVVFDTSRAWCGRMALLNRLYPDFKVIACVRHMPWIIDSFERVFRANALRASSVFQNAASTTVYARVDAIAAGNGSVGYAFNALREGYFGEFAQRRLMLLQYETLVQDPGRAMEAVYRFIEEDGFQHDFQRVVFEPVAYDEKAGLRGLHEVKPVVASTPRESVLPPDLYNRFENDSFWRQPATCREGIVIV